MAIRNVTATTCSDLTNVQIIIDDSGIDFSKIYQLPDGRCVTLTSGTTSTYSVNSYFPYGPYDTCTLCQVPLSGSTGGNTNICQALCSGKVKLQALRPPFHLSEPRKNAPLCLHRPMR